MTRFLSYCAEGFVTGLTAQQDWIYDRQFQLTWHEYVGEKVTGRDPDVRERRMLIAEALFRREPVPKNGISHLTTRLAELYAVCGVKTMARDLRELVDSGLLRATPTGFVADTDALLSLLPLVVPPAGI